MPIHVDLTHIGDGFEIERTIRNVTRRLWDERGSLGFDVSPEPSQFAQLRFGVESRLNARIDEIVYHEFRRILTEDEK